METKAEIADAVESIAIAMYEVAGDTHPYWPDKANELQGAAKIVGNWVYYMREAIDREHGKVR